MKKYSIELMFELFIARVVSRDTQKKQNGEALTNMRLIISSCVNVIGLVLLGYLQISTVPFFTCI